MNNRLYIVVLNWNGTADTIACIESIKKSTLDNYTVILVDNGSEQINLQKLHHWCKSNFTEILHYDRTQTENSTIQGSPNNDSAERLIFIENKENLGFAAGNNVALRYLQKINAEYAMLLNNDTVIESSSSEILHNFMLQNTDYVAITPQIRYFSPNDKIWNCGGQIVLNRTRKYYFANSSTDSLTDFKPFRITFITGCALLLRLKETGLLSEKFFFGEEDFEFSLRMKKQKKKMACIPESIIYHKVGSSINKNQNMINKSYLFYINRLINLKSYNNKIIWFLTLPFYIFLATLNISLRNKLKFKIIPFYLSLLTSALKLNTVDRVLFNKIMTTKF